MYFRGSRERSTIRYVLRTSQRSPQTLHRECGIIVALRTEALRFPVLAVASGNRVPTRNDAGHRRFDLPRRTKLLRTHPEPSGRAPSQELDRTGSAYAIVSSDGSSNRRDDRRPYRGTLVRKIPRTGSAEASDGRCGAPGTKNPHSGNPLRASGTRRTIQGDSNDDARMRAPPFLVPTTFTGGWQNRDDTRVHHAPHMRP
jgi:hypothetical protein